MKKEGNTMNKRCLTWIAAILALTCVLGLAVLAGGCKQTVTPDEPTTVSEEDYEIFHMPVEKMERIQWTYKGYAYCIYVEDGTWKLEEDPSIELDQSRCKAIANSMEKLTAEKFIESTDREGMGLTDPSTVVTLTADGGRYVFRFGDENATMGQYYLEYDGKISLVPAYKKTVFDKSLLSLTGGEEPIETDLTNMADESSEETEETEEPTEEETEDLGTEEEFTGVEEGWEDAPEDMEEEFTGIGDEEETETERGISF